MRLLLSCFCVLFLLLGCTKFEINNQIYPKITIIGDKVGVVYKLGKLRVNDTWELYSNEIEYLKRNKNNMSVYLYIIYDTANKGSDVQFHYYVDGFHIYTSYDTVSPNMLLANMDNIPNFYLYELNGEEIMEEDESVIQEQLDKIKNEVKEEQKESKWTQDEKY